MANENGDFVWYELMTTDADAAQDFYTGLIGWNWADSGQDGVDYRIFSAGSEQIGGMLALNEEMTAGGAQPAWLGYVQTDDLSGALSKWKAAGGSVMIEGQEVPGVGPFAMVTDPQGVPLYLIDDQSGEESTAFSAYEPKVGHCAWNELVTADPGAAKSFYGDIYGWVVGESMDMGPMGQYEMLKNGEARDFMFGAVMKKPDEMPVSAWAYYFRVPDIDAAQAYIEEKGGQIMNGPMEIPGGDFVIQGSDPQGAFFSIIGARK